MRIAITTDHTGFETVKELKQFLETLGHECVDFGPKTLDKADDYPDFMFPAAEAVAEGDCDMGIIMGGSGQGEAIAANRVRGVRCAVFYGPVVARTSVDAEGTMSDDPFEIVKLSRSHNNANVLSLAARFLTMEQMEQACELWLSTEFSGLDRHVRRVAKLG